MSAHIVPLHMLSTKQVSKMPLIGSFVEIKDDEEMVQLEITQMKSTDSCLGKVLNVVAESTHKDYPSILYVFGYEEDELIDVIS